MRAAWLWLVAAACTDPSRSPRAHVGDSAAVAFEDAGAAKDAADAVGVAYADASPTPDTVFAVDVAVPDDVAVPEDVAPAEDVAPPQDIVPAPDASAVPDALPTTCTAAGIPGTCLPTSLCPGPLKATPGLCPGPAGIQCCTPAITTACDAAATLLGQAPLPKAGLLEPPGVGGCPAGMLPVDGFCIDRYEAALVQVLANGQTAPWSPYVNPGKANVRAVSLAGVVPQGHISGVQAKTACVAAGKRLCTDTEWLRACQGPNKTTYPYGKALQPGTCNDARPKHPAVELFGTGSAWIWSQLNHPCLNQLAASLDTTGQRVGCVTPEGVYDLMGNLHEWTADPAGTFRGGFYADTKVNGPGCLYATKAHDVGHWDYSTGFRCCADLP